jgi:hypothetical protein
MPGRTARQCRDRYEQYLAQTVCNAPWSAQEDRVLLDKVKQYGNHWTQIAQFFPQRNANSLKNRWHSVLTRQGAFRDIPRVTGEPIGFLSQEDDLSLDLWALDMDLHWPDSDSTAF